MARSVKTQKLAEVQLDGAEGQPRAHTLSMRLTIEQYRRLRRYVMREEDRLGRRVSYQAIMETALDEYLGGRRR